MAITGVHALFHTSAPDELRAVLRDVMGWEHVDAGGGWLIFKLPPAELGVHPGDAAGHEVSFVCDDLDATMSELHANGIEFRGDPEQRSFGRGIHMVLPGDVDVLLYEARHKTAF